MPMNPNAQIEITAFRWVPEFAQGVVRDLRARWALEEAGLDYRVRLLGQERPRLVQISDRQVDEDHALVGAHSFLPCDSIRLFFALGSYKLQLWS